MGSKLVTRIARYGRVKPAGRCPDCGAPLVVTHVETHGHGLRIALSCSTDCGYARRPRVTTREAF